MKQEVLDRFKSYGINVDGDTPSALAGELVKQDSETLRNIMDDFSEDVNLDLSGSEYLQCMTMSYALVSALEDGRDSVTQDDIKAAQKEVSEELGEAIDEPDTEQAEDTSQASAEPTRVHDPNFRATIERLVMANPDAQADEIVRLTLDELPGKNPGTARCHYYDVRRKNNMETLGKRGRKKGSGKLPVLAQFVADNPDSTRDEVIKYAIDELGLTEATASNYYPKIPK